MIILLSIFTVEEVTGRSVLDAMDWCTAQREWRCRYCFYIRRGVWNQPGKGTDATRAWECLFNVTEGVTFKYRRCRITWFVRLGESPIVGEWSKMSIVLLRIPSFSSCRFSNQQEAMRLLIIRLFTHLWEIFEAQNTKLYKIYLVCKTNFYLGFIFFIYSQKMLISMNIRSLSIVRLSNKVVHDNGDTHCNRSQIFISTTICKSGRVLKVLIICNI